MKTRIYATPAVNPSFTDFPLIKLPSETDFFLRRTPEVAPVHHTGYSYAHAHIAQIKNAREHYVTDISGWRFSTIAINVCTDVNSHKCEIGKGRVKGLMLSVRRKG